MSVRFSFKTLVLLVSFAFSNGVFAQELRKISFTEKRLIKRSAVILGRTMFAPETRSQETKKLYENMVAMAQVKSPAQKAEDDVKQKKLANKLSGFQSRRDQVYSLGSRFGENIVEALKQKEQGDLRDAELALSTAVAQYLEAVFLITNNGSSYYGEAHVTAMAYALLYLPAMVAGAMLKQPSAIHWTLVGITFAGAAAFFANTNSRDAGKGAFFRIPFLTNYLSRRGEAKRLLSTFSIGVESSLIRNSLEVSRVLPPKFVGQGFLKFPTSLKENSEWLRTVGEAISPGFVSSEIRKMMLCEEPLATVIKI